MGKQWKQCQTLFFGAPKSLQMVIAAMKLKDAYSLEGKFWPTQIAYWKAETLLCQQRSVSSRLCMVFPVVMCGCESWTVKKAERQRIDAFELWCWRLLRVPWTARRSNQSILKEISPGISLDGMMLKLKLQYFGHLMWKVNSLEKTLMLGGIGGRRRRGRQRMRWLEGMTNLDSIFKSRDTTLPTKVHLVKAMVFPVVMYGCECWTVKKAECWRIDAFEL